VKIGRGVPKILKFCHRNMRRCNVGIIEGETEDYAVDMGSGDMTYSTSSVTILSGI
jgi:hypothetical protein